MAFFLGDTKGPAILATMPILMLDTEDWPYHKRGESPPNLCPLNIIMLFSKPMKYQVINHLISKLTESDIEPLSTPDPDHLRRAERLIQRKEMSRINTIKKFINRENKGRLKPERPGKRIPAFTRRSIA